MAAHHLTSPCGTTYQPKVSFTKIKAYLSSGALVGTLVHVSNHDRANIRDLSLFQVLVRQHVADGDVTYFFEVATCGAMNRTDFDQTRHLVGWDCSEPTLKNTPFSLRPKSFLSLRHIVFFSTTYRGKKHTWRFRKLDLDSTVAVIIPYVHHLHTMLPVRITLVPHTDEQITTYGVRSRETPACIRSSANTCSSVRPSSLTKHASTHETLASDNRPMT